MLEITDEVCVGVGDSTLEKLSDDEVLTIGMLSLDEPEIESRVLDTTEGVGVGRGELDWLSEDDTAGRDELGVGVLEGESTDELGDDSGELLVLESRTTGVADDEKIDDALILGSGVVEITTDVELATDELD